MRLPLILALAAAAAPAASAGPAPAADMPVFKPGPTLSSVIDCPPTSRFHAARRDKNGRTLRDGRALFNQLDNLPPADAYKAVLRHDGRCEAPIIVRYGIGGR